MARLVFALMLVLVLVTPSLGQQSLVGTYKVISEIVEVDGTPSQNSAKPRTGYLVLTPTRAIAFSTTGERTFGTSVAEKAALLDSMAGWAGTYRVEGDKLITTAEVSYTENLNGKPMVNTCQLSGNRLTTTSEPMPYPREPSKTMIRRAVYEKIE